MKIRICAMRGRGGMSGEKDSWHNVLELGDDITNTITSVHKDNLVLYEMATERLCDTDDRPPQREHTDIR